MITSETLHPLFTQAMEELRRLTPEQVKGERGTRWLRQAFRHAPPEFKDAAHQSALEMGLMPAADAYTEGGEPQPLLPRAALPPAGT